MARPLGTLILWMLCATSLAHADPAPPTSGVATAKPALPTSQLDASRALDAAAAKIAKLGGQSSLKVIDLGADGAVVGAHEAELAHNPASNAKLWTAAIALDRLGAEHRFFTGLYGKQRGDTVSTLVLRGAGDPTFESADLRGLVDVLVLRGVRRVDRIEVDQSLFEGSYVPPAFEQQPGEWAAFRAPVSAAALDRNTLTIRITSGPDPDTGPRVALSPPGVATLALDVRTGAAKSAEKLILDTAVVSGKLRVSLSGSVPAGQRSVAYTRRLEDPNVVIGLALADMLRERQIEVGSEIRDGGAGQNTLLAAHRSESLGVILQALGKNSDNFVAEMLLLTAGAKAKPRANYEQATVAARETLAARGAFPNGSLIRNGSGLFDANRASASGMCALLASMAADPKVSAEYVAHLAIGGVDGTLRHRLKSVAGERRVRAKTGTLAKSTALSGYVLGSNGSPRLAFSMIAETEKTGEAAKAIDQAVVELVRLVIASEAAGR